MIRTVALLLGLGLIAVIGAIWLVKPRAELNPSIEEDSAVSVPDKREEGPYETTREAQTLDEASPEPAPPRSALERILAGEKIEPAPYVPARDTSRPHTALDRILAGEEIREKTAQRQ